MRIPLLVVAVLVALLAVPSVAAACDCPMITTEDAVKRAKRVVIAKQVSFDWGEPAVGQYEVYYAFKGTSEKSLTIKLDGGISNCFPYLEDGAVGVFFFDDNAEPLSVCTGSGTLIYEYDRAVELIEMGGGGPIDSGRVVPHILRAVQFEKWQHKRTDIPVVYPALDGKKLKVDGLSLSFVEAAKGEHFVLTASQIDGLYAIRLEFEAEGLLITGFARIVNDEVEVISSRLVER